MQGLSGDGSVNGSERNVTMNLDATLDSRVRPMRDPVCILGLPIDVIDMDHAAACVRQAARTGQRMFISTPNLNFLMAAQKDHSFRESVLRSDLSLADGVSLLALAAMMGLDLPGRVSGADLFLKLWEGDGGPPIRVFFFGGPPGAAELAAKKINDKRGGLACVGWDEAGFGDVESMSSPDLIDRINRSGADFVVVSLGAKKGQAWIMHNRHRLKAPVISHLGAVVNFTAGTVRRAPKWMQRMSLEWMWRALTEKGLTKRYWDDVRSLVPLLFSKVMIAGLHERMVRFSSQRPADMSEKPSIGPTRHLTLSGFWTHADSVQLARCLAQDTRRDVRIDASGIDWLDLHTIGVLAVHHGKVRESGGQGVVIEGLVHSLAKQVCRDGADYLIASVPQ
jgi:N-acetylglucosaminyldiphosphoundecaprenol N-acetyl-beta-D-mannosaminyltransferase